MPIFSSERIWFSVQIDEVENKMSLHGCVQGVATADDGPDCVMLRKMRRQRGLLADLYLRAHHER